jgi:DNA processing protein
VELAARLAERGVAIVSGGAAGIDAAAHEGALQVGGTTVVVAPSSFDCPFPEEHGALFERIVESGGAYISAYEANVQARPDRFLLRNSYLVALSQALIVVEAPIRSGARNAAKWARRLRFTFFVVPAVPWNTQGEGSIAELKLGGRPLASYKDVLRWLEQRQQHPVAPAAAGAVPGPEEAEQPKATARPARARPAKRAVQRAQPPPARAGGEALGDPALDSIVAAVRSGCHTADEIGQSAKLGAAAVSHGLLLLTLQGVVVQTGGEVRLVD